MSFLETIIKGIKLAQLLDTDLLVCRGSKSLQITRNSNGLTQGLDPDRFFPHLLLSLCMSLPPCAHTTHTQGFSADVLRNRKLREHQQEV